MCVFLFIKTFISEKLNISCNCREEALEIFANELQTKSYKLIILSIYRVPTGDFNQFIKNLDDALKHPYKSKPELLIHGDINIDYLTVSN